MLQDTLLQSTVAKPCPLIISYPADVKSAQAKKAYKHRTLRENPEALTADFCHTGVITNLLLYTDSTEAWHKAICAHYHHHKKRGICSGRQIVIEDEDKDILTVNVYHNGTIMFQGNEASLNSVQEDYNAIKALAETEKQKQDQDSSEDRTSNTEQPSGRGREEEQLSGDCSVHSSQLESRMSQMRESLSLQEVELVELKELLLSNQTATESTQQLRDQYSQVRNELKVSLQELRGEVQELRGEVQELQQNRQAMERKFTAVREELQQERQAKERELTAMREELHQREDTIINLKEQLQGLRASKQQPSIITNNTPHSEPQPSTSTHTDTRPSQQPAVTPTPIPSTRDPHKEATTSRPSKASGEERIASDADIVILIDSNGKFVDANQLFPAHKVKKIWCPRTDNAFQLLTESTLGQPSHIIIHTGSNDLRLQQERVAESVRRVAQRATQTFPSSKIIISTILPRRDFHPDTIQRINADISRGCAPMPNVHLAHHPTLNIHSLYDHVHLRKDTVSTFAKSLKDVALGRSPGTPPRTSRRPSLHAASLKPSPPHRPSPHPAGPYHPPAPHPQGSRPRTRAAAAPQRTIPPVFTRPHPAPHPASPAQNYAQHPEQRSYAEALMTPTSTGSTVDLGEIKHLLSLICTRLMS